MKSRDQSNVDRLNFIEDTALVSESMVYMVGRENALSLIQLVLHRLEEIRRKDGIEKLVKICNTKTNGISSWELKEAGQE